MKLLTLIAAAALATGCTGKNHDMPKAETAFNSCMAATPIASSSYELDRKIQGCKIVAWASQ